MSTVPSTRAPHAPLLLAELKQRPVLLLRELFWRWSCGGVLLLLASYQGWRIWATSLPALQATGLFPLTLSSVVDDPAAAGSEALASFAILWPPIARACLGLAPIAVFAWVLAFAWGRSSVLAEYDPQLPRRPWLLVEAEALRIGSQCLVLCVWAAVVFGVCRWTMTGSPPHLLVGILLIAAATTGALTLVTSLRRAMIIATALALVEGVPFRSVWKRATTLHRLERFRPLRRAVQRIRLILLATGLALMVIPNPFPLDWRFLAWCVLLSLPSLAATDAWRLGAFLLLLQAARERVSRAGEKDAF